MAEQAVVFTDVPKLVAHSLTQALRGHAIEVATYDELRDDCVYVQVVYISANGLLIQHHATPTADDSRWRGTLLLTDQFDDHFFKASVGRGHVPMTIDQPAKDLADIIGFRLRGYAALRAEPAFAIFPSPLDELKPNELELVRNVEPGDTVRIMAEKLYTSERNARRPLASIKTESGADTNAEAIEYYQSFLSNRQTDGQY